MNITEDRGIPADISASHASSLKWEIVFIGFLIVELTFSTYSDMSDMFVGVNLSM